MFTPACPALACAAALLLSACDASGAIEPDARQIENAPTTLDKGVVAPDQQPIPSARLDRDRARSQEPVSPLKEPSMHSNPPSPPPPAKSPAKPPAKPPLPQVERSPWQPPAEVDPVRPPPDDAVPL